MKVLLVDNMVLPEEGSLASIDVHPHLGLLALAAAAEGHGHAVEIYDPKRLIRLATLQYDSTLYERVAFDLLAERPSVVGFTTLGCSVLFALNVATILKREEPGLPILLGGPHATMLHRQILERFPQFDIVVRHEADEIIPAVLDNLARRSFEKIPGITWRASNRIGLRSTDGRPKVEDLDSLPFLSYDHYPVSELGLELLRIEAGRGCPFMCTFCSTAGFFQRSFRLKSAERLVKELDVLHAQYGYSDFKLDHDMFTVNRRKVLEFCEAVEGRGYRWRASARIDCVDADLLERMAQAGCVNLYFGIETGSARMQKICKKGLDLDLVLPILHVAARLGIQTTASFITGYPEERERDQDDTLDLLGRCFRRTCLPQLHILTPEPGTAMFDQLGSKIAYDGYGGPYNSRLIGADDERLIREHPDIFQTYYYYPAEMSRPRYIFAVEAVSLFRRVGPITLAYILRAYEGQLSKLVGELRLFADRHYTGMSPDFEMVKAYISQKFGPGHHVTSLVRYALRAGGVGREEGPAKGPKPAVFDPEMSYRRSSHVRVLSEIHDCAILLEQIERHPVDAGFLDQADIGELGSYLDNGSEIYWVEAGVQAIVDLFDEPRTCGVVADMLCETLGVSEIDFGVFESLVHGYVLVAAGAATVPSIAQR